MKLEFEISIFICSAKYVDQVCTIQLLDKFLYAKKSKNLDPSCKIEPWKSWDCFNPSALRKTKIENNFGLSESNGFNRGTRNVTVCNRCPRRSVVRDTPSHYALSFCDVSLNLLQ